MTDARPTTRLTGSLEGPPPIVWALLAYLVAIVLVAPWGNFPLNDDWKQAHLAKKLAETGRFRVDVPTAPSSVGQSLLAVPFIRTFGFSHTLLRVLTIALGGTGLWLLSRLLSYGGVGRGLQALALVTLATSPLYLYLSLTFLTEIYGWGLGLLGAVVWMRARARSGERGLPGWATTLGTAAIVGATFWIRQSVVVVFPALIAACLLELALERQWTSLRRIAPRIGMAMLVFGAVVAAYFPFARSIGGLRTQMSGPLAGLLEIQPKVWVLHLGTFLIYMAVFLYPLLTLFGFKEVPRRRAAAAGVFVGLAVGASLLQILATASERLLHGDFVHRTFPFLGNLIHAGGLGPITLSDVYALDKPQPRLPDAFWLVVQVVAILLAAYWAAFFASALGAFEKGIRREVFAFGLLLTAVSLVLTWQTFKGEVFDRYYFPCVLGGALALATRLERRAGEASRRALLFRGASLLPLAVFTVLGLHDYFRWNEARWQLFDDAVAVGIDPALIDGGYEVDGWVWREPPPRAGRQACIGGRCHCDGVWWHCHDASYRIGMNVVDGYEEVRRLEPRYWLAGWPLILTKRVER